MILTILVVAQLQQPTLRGVDLGPAVESHVVSPQVTHSPQQAPQVYGPYTLNVPKNELKCSDVIKDINNGSLRWDK